MRSKSDIRVVSEPTLRRLPSYLRLVKELSGTGLEWVSCTHISETLGRDPTQVRKDLSATGVVGKPKVGYRVADLIASIEHFLGWDNVSEAFLAGAGNLGSALLGYHGFEQHGLRIVAAFDADSSKIGGRIHDVPVLALSELAGLARRMHVQMGIVATPADCAQEVADTMVRGGIRAIWNFAPVTLRVPEKVIVENEHLSATLAVISRRLAALREKPAADEGAGARAPDHGDGMPAADDRPAPQA